MKLKWALLALIPVAAVSAMLAGQRKSAAEKEFASGLGRTTLTVYPTVVRMGRTTQTDGGAAREVAAYFERRALGHAAVHEEPVQFALEASFNQAKMYRRSLAAFQAHIKAHPPQTKYAAMAEYLLGSNGNVGGIHLYVVRADGAEADGVLLNSHWKEFKAVKPHTVQDATRALLLRLDSKWKPPIA